MELFKLYATGIAPTISTILITIAYLPQIIKTFRTKSVKDLSLGFWVLISAFLVNMVINATYLFVIASSKASAIGYLATETVNLSMAIVVVCQIVHYSRKVK